MGSGNFFSELKRRNVYKVAVAYAVVAWLLIQGASILFPTFDAPSWVMKVFVAVVLAGFPVALVLGWAFELTAQGITRTDEHPTAQDSSAGGAWIYVVAVGAVLSIGVFLLGRYTAKTGSSASTPAIPEKSIAVLPFANLSEDKANAYFADGIQDEILTRLAKIESMKVISRTSTQQFGSKPGSVTDIAKQLAVAHILEGSVQKAGDSVRVNVQLIKGEHDSHIWAETYDRKLTDIFAVESEIAEKIADSLAAHLTGRERQAIANVPTQNPQAYDNYLRALALLNRQGAGQLTQARKALERAIELDPQYAQAWARLALAESEIYFGGAPGEHEQTPAQLERARRAAERAMQLQPDLSDSHLGLGSFYYYCLQDFDRALAELSEARKLAPNDAYVIFATGLVKRRQGKLHEALKLQEEAVVLDPRNSDMWVNLGRTYGGLRDFTRSREMYDRAIAIAPDEPDIVAEKADTFIVEGNLDAAERAIAQLGPTELGSSAFGTRLTLFILRRQFDRAIELLSRSVNASDTPRAIRARDRVDLGALQVALNQPAGRANVEQGRAELIAMRNEGDTAPENVASLVMAAAWLGDRPTLDRESEALLRKTERDRWQFPRAQVTVAGAYALVGDAQRAVEFLAAALSAPNDGTPTAALLRIDPLWDKIRDDARFQKLCSDA